MSWSIPARIAGLVALYAILAALWIYLSDEVVALLASTPARLTQLQTVKGWAFVAVTATLLGLILRHEARARSAGEQALRESEDTYRTLVEVESDAVFLIDNTTGQLLAANPAAAQLYGYTQAELLRLRNTDLSAEPAETAWVTTSTPLAPETIVRIPLRHHKKRDGTVFAVEITGRFFAWRGRSVHLAAIRDITARQEAEATLVRYRLLAEQARDIVLFVRRDGRILEANQAAVEAYGYTTAEFGALHIQDLRAPETQALTAGQMAQADAAGLLFETVHRRKDGTTFPVEVSSRGADLGGSRVLLSIIRDITDRQRAAHALATRSRQLEAVQAITAEITRELDLEALLALIQRRAIALVGGTGGSLYLWDEGGQVLIPQVWDGIPDVVGSLPVRPGEGLAGTVAAQRMGLLVNDYRDSAAAHPRFLAETGIVAALGEPLLYHERLVGVIVLNSTQPGRTFGDEERALLALVAQHAAIAIENARLFRAERDRRAQLEALRATTADLTRELDLTQLLHLLIARAAELVGASSATVYLWDPAQGLVVPAAWHGLGDYQATIRHGLGQGIAGTVSQTRRGLCANDYRTSRYANPVTLHHTAVTASMGEPLLYRDELIGALTLNHEGGLTFSAQDQAVLRLFADQAAIAIKNARLYSAAQQALTDLRQAQDELIRAETLRGLGQMAAGIAHDLNNTLATILGQTELLRLRTRSPAVQEGLETLQTAATDGAAVVRRLQDFARQRGAGPLRPCDLTQLVTEALEITRPRWREEPRRKGGVIEPTVDLAGLPLIEGQPSEIREALTNLVFNAVDAMPDGGHLRFTGRVVEAAEGDPPAQPPRDAVSPGAAPTAWVELTVTDTGIGMTDEVRGRIFDPFFTTKGLHGTGLGLSVVYGIMERHGGRIDVTSAPGQGTTFRLRFRAAPQDAVQTDPHSTSALAPTRRILLVDDDASVRRTLAGLLRASGQEVLEADSGAAALRWLETTSVDLVLTDLGMPEVTGWDVARAAKAQRPDLPVVLLTGWGDHVGTEAPPDVRVDRVLTKPVLRSNVLAAIAELAGPRQALSGAEPSPCDR